METCITTGPKWAAASPVSLGDCLDIMETPNTKQPHHNPRILSTPGDNKTPLTSVTGGVQLVQQWRPLVAQPLKATNHETLRSSTGQSEWLPARGIYTVLAIKLLSGTLGTSNHRRGASSNSKEHDAHILLLPNIHSNSCR